MLDIEEFLMLRELDEQGLSMNVIKVNLFTGILSHAASCGVLR
jgi:hypothetical protein